MKRFRVTGYFTLVTTLILTLLATVKPASANVTSLVLSSRTCGTISAYLVYDSYSEGNPPFWAVFSVDLNGNKIYGEAGEPQQYVKVLPGNAGGTLGAQLVGTRMAFRAVPEGSTISVTAYEVDSEGVAVSAQVSPVSYQCTHRPAIDLLPPNTGIVIPGVGITAKINVTAVQVYREATVKSEILGGLGKGAFVNVIARNQRGDWVQIEFRNGKGWIMWQTQALLFGPYSSLKVLPNVESPAPAAK
jgi:hypothetical protein